MSLRAFIKLFVLLCVVSCSVIACKGKNQITKENYEKLDYGITKTQVEAILGKGDKYSDNKNMSFVQYKSDDANQRCEIAVVFKDGKLTDKYLNGSQDMTRKK